MHWRRGATIAIITALVIARPALASVEFNYYRLTTTPTGVVLEWSTAREIHVAGFFVAYKPTVAPESAYETFGYAVSAGGPDTGAVYSFSVNVRDADVTYCVRVTEQTTTDTPGEVIEQCGYGPSATSPPIIFVLTPAPVSTSDGSATPPSYPPPSSGDPTPTPKPGPTRLPCPNR